MDITGKKLEELLKSEKTVMVEFWGSWCPPCQHMKDVLDDIKKEYDGRVTIAKVNVDRNPMVSKKFDVVGVPSFMIFQDGEMVHRDVGAKSVKQLQDMIESVI